MFRARILTGLVTRIHYPWPVYRAYSLSSKEVTLSFSQFKQTQVETLDEYSNCPIVRELLKDRPSEVSRAYEDYCRVKYNHYKLLKYGGNPSTMI